MNGIPHCVKEASLTAIVFKKQLRPFQNRNRLVDRVLIDVYRVEKLNKVGKRLLKAFLPIFDLDLVDSRR